MPRGPYDDQIEEKDQETDHARERLEQFRQQRVPTSDQHGEANTKDNNTAKPDSQKPQRR